MRVLEVGERPLAIEDIVAIARDGARVELAPAARARIAAARAVVLRLAQGEAPIYGVNSALGANTGQRLDASDLAEYQRRAIRARVRGASIDVGGEDLRRDARKRHRFVQPHVDDGR